MTQIKRNNLYAGDIELEKRCDGQLQPSTIKSDCAFFDFVENSVSINFLN